MVDWAVNGNLGATPEVQTYPNADICDGTGRYEVQIYPNADICDTRKCCWAKCCASAANVQKSKARCGKMRCKIEVFAAVRTTTGKAGHDSGGRGGGGGGQEGMERREGQERGRGRKRKRVVAPLDVVGKVPHWSRF